jgi:hypothetical protein
MKLDLTGKGAVTGAYASKGPGKVMDRQGAALDADSELPGAAFR